jgi:hypothetical protein
MVRETLNATVSPKILSGGIRVTLAQRDNPLSCPLLTRAACLNKFLVSIL